MKLTAHVAVALAAITLLCCCGRRESDAPQQTVLVGITEQRPESRSTMNSGIVYWTAGDRIRVYDATGTNSEAYTLDDADDGASVGHFNGNSLASGACYAVYPESIAGTLQSGKMSLSLPQVQTYKAGSFSTGTSPAIASISGNRMQFMNLCGLVSVNLTGSVMIDKVELSTLSNEALWGNAEVELPYGDQGPVIKTTGTMTDDRRTLVLDCGEGVQLSSAQSTFFFIVPTGSLSEGFRVKVYDSANGTMTVETTKSELVAERSIWKNMKALEYMPTESPFLSQSVYGVYDICNGEANALKTYEKGKDQIALVETSSTNTFRIQSLVSKTAVSIAVPNSAAKGQTVNVSVSTVGNSGVQSVSADMLVLKAEDGKLWITDSARNIGYIIAGEI